MRVRRICRKRPEPGDAGTPRLAWALVKITAGSNYSLRKEQIRILLACEQQSSEQGLQKGESVEGLSALDGEGFCEQVNKRWAANDQEDKIGKGQET